METDDQTDEVSRFYASQADTYDVFDRARLALLRRAIRDPDLIPQAKLILFVLARKADKLNYSVSYSYRELEDATGLGSGAVGKGIRALRDRGYIKVAGYSAYRLLPLRAVT